MKDMMKHLSLFTTARVVLSVWYTLILILILGAFSIALTTTYTNDVTRIVLRQDFGNHVPSKLSASELRLVLAQVRELRNTSRLDILVIDCITVIVGGGLSFFLAGKTLDPIQKSILSQKLFIADASHELKSPVAAIRSACEVMLRSHTKTKEEYKQTLELVQDQSIRLGKLITDLLSLSVLDAGDAKPLARVSLSTVTEKALETFIPVLKQNKISLEKHINSSVVVMGDADKLEQLVIILLDNASKYTRSNGKVSVTVAAQPTPHLIVRDTGIGISPEKQKNIFQRFYQIDPSHSDRGAGLGLSIADSIMRLHKGDIFVKSQVGKGSTFTCVFPGA